MQTQQTSSTPKVIIGMDIHKKSWSVSIRTDICDHRTLNMPADADGLYDYISSNFPGHEVSIAYEAGCCGFSAARHFIGMGWKVLVVNPADVPRMDKQNYQKTDKIDSRNLCKQLYNNNLRGIYIPTSEEEELRSLVRHRNQIVKQLRKEQTHIKSMLLFHGITIPIDFDNNNWSKAFIKWLKNLNW